MKIFPIFLTITKAVKWEDIGEFSIEDLENEALEAEKLEGIFSKKIFLETLVQILFLRDSPESS